MASTGDVKTRAVIQFCVGLEKTPCIRFQVAWTISGGEDSD